MRSEKCLKKKKKLKKAFCIKPEEHFSPTYIDGKKHFNHCPVLTLPLDQCLKAGLYVYVSLIYISKCP